MKQYHNISYNCINLNDIIINVFYNKMYQACIIGLKLV